MKRSAGADSPVALAHKLVALASEQGDALQRGDTSQYDWLVLRRDEVTDGLNRLVAAGAVLSPREATAVSEAREELAELDRAMESHVREALSLLGQRRSALAHHRKVMSPYLAAACRTPAFVDKKG